MVCGPMKRKTKDKRRTYIARIKDGLSKITIPSKRDEHRKYIKLEEDKVIKKLEKKEKV